MLHVEWGNEMTVVFQSHLLLIFGYYGAISKVRVNYLDLRVNCAELKVNNLELKVNNFGTESE